MNERLKQLRKYKKMTQEEFAKKIGIKRNTLANYEIGRNEPIDAVIFSICREFNVNEEWLRNGEGEMFVKMSDDEQLANFMGKLFSKEDDTAKKKVFRAMSKLPDEWFLQFYDAIVEESNKNE